MATVRTTDSATLLLLEETRFDNSDRVLLLSADDPALALNAAARAAQVTVYDASYGALRRLSTLAAARRADNLTLEDGVFPPSEPTYDVALMVVPKGRDFARAQIYAAWGALKPGGRLYIAGPTNSGAKSVIEDAAALFGRCVTLATKQRHRLGVAAKSGSAEALTYPAEWGDDPTVGQIHTFETPGGPVRVATMPGIFSYEHLDDGTAFLLENLSIPDMAEGSALTVLDVGCGNGIMGVFIAPRAAHLLMIDENLLAVACARETTRINDLPNTEVQPGDVYAELEGRRFDLIVSNPPFHKAFDVNTNVAHRIMRGASAMLKPGGRVVIVANAFLGYEKVMAQHLSKSRVLAKNNRFTVIEGSV